MKLTTALALRREVEQLLELSEKLEYKLGKTLDAYRKAENIKGVDPGFTGGRPDEYHLWLFNIREGMQNSKTTYGLKSLKKNLDEYWSVEARVCKMQGLLEETWGLYDSVSSEAEDQSNYKVKRLFEELKEIINDNSGTWNIPNRKENDDE